jgi:hypothetical protein
MAKSLLKKAKKAAKSVKKEVEILAEQKRKKDEIDAPALPVSSPKAPKVSIREHIEKLSGERGDCSAIWTLIKNGEQYRTDEKIKELIKAKGYETLLGEIS